MVAPSRSVLRDPIPRRVVHLQPSPVAESSTHIRHCLPLDLLLFLHLHTRFTQYMSVVTYFFLDFVQQLSLLKATFGCFFFSYE